jgi:hypothetical protein
VRIAAKAYNYAVTRDTNNVVYLLTWLITFLIKI